MAKNKGARVIVGIVFLLIAAVIFTVGIISEFAIMSAAIAVLLVFTGIQIARGKM
jgi:hypothetical protein